MNKILRKTMLFLFILCMLLVLIIGIRNNYIEFKQKEFTQNIINNIKVVEDEKTTNELPEGGIGLIKIPSIEVIAPIYEGTNKEVLKYAVGHFENTSLWFRKCCTCIT